METSYAALTEALRAEYRIEGEDRPHYQMLIERAVREYLVLTVLDEEEKTGDLNYNRHHKALLATLEQLMRYTEAQRVEWNLRQVLEAQDRLMMILTEHLCEGCLVRVRKYLPTKAGTPGHDIMSAS